LEKKEEETKMSLVSCQAEKMASQAREKALQLQVEAEAEIVLLHSS